MITNKITPHKVWKVKNKRMDWWVHRSEKGIIYETGGNRGHLWHRKPNLEYVAKELNKWYNRIYRGETVRSVEVTDLEVVQFQLQNVETKNLF